MKSKTLFPGILSLLLIVAFACEKDDTPSCSYPENAKLKRIVSCSDFDITCPALECSDIIRIVKEFEYDGNGRLEWELFHSKHEYLLHKYNSQNQLVKIEYYGEYKDENLPYQIITYSYSYDGKKIKESIELGVSGEYGTQYKLYKYSDNRLTRIDVYEFDSDELDDYILMEYDDSGNLVKEKVYNKDGAHRYTIQHVFENGLNVMSHHTTGSFIKSYDENENLVFVESDYLSGSSKGNFRHKYEYYN
jgi:hypothetical protein